MGLMRDFNSTFHNGSKPLDINPILWWTIVPRASACLLNHSVRLTSPLTQFCFALLALITTVVPLHGEPRHGIAMHGIPALTDDFHHLTYANPNASPGGTVTFAALGSFDSVNPFIVKGRPARALRDHVFESLMKRNYDEPFTLYGLIAKSIETPIDRSWVEFVLNDAAIFSDGTPVTVDDVIYSLETLRKYGRPNHRSYYSKVVKIERPSRSIVRFVLANDADREMPLILGLMPILPKHYYSSRIFNETTLEPPIGSGPYTIDNVDAGSSITYKKNPRYWGENLSINRGLNNFDTIKYEYYRDESTRFEAFKKGLFDFQQEWDPARWANSYAFPATDDGRIVREEIGRATPAGMLGLAFNTRRQIFSDQRIRRALTLMFDFEWLNANLYHGLYQRTSGFYDGSELSSIGQPASEVERALLNSYTKMITPDVLEGSYRLDAVDKGEVSSGRKRSQSRQALNLFNEAGYDIDKHSGQMVEKKSGIPFSFEIMVVERRQERYALTYSKSLKRLGIDASVRLVDSAQYQLRRQTYDFDMVEHFWYASLSPGNEQAFYWSTNAAATEGTRNYMGARNSGVDGMIKALLSAHERNEFVSAVRALDRLLISGNYVIPLFHWPKQWLAYSQRLAHPENHSVDGYKLNTWWVKKPR
jgi:peptide/nickel transport system substrate-binding protein